MSRFLKVATARNIMGTPMMLLITLAIWAVITLAASKLATTDGLMVVVTTNLTKLHREASIRHP